MSEGFLATLIHEDESSTWSAEETELVKPAARCDQDSLLERAIMTGWRLYGESERDVDELVAVAMEAIEEDVTDYDMCTDLIQMIQEVFDRARSFSDLLRKMTPTLMRARGPFFFS